MITRAIATTVCWALLALVAWVVPASAVLLDPGDGSQNTTPPADFPWWDHVAARGGLTAVYMGDGWVLTARHVAAGSIIIDGVTYQFEAGSVVEFENPDETIPDLHAYRIVTPPYPPLGLLPLVTATPPVGSEYVAIGHGFDRGNATKWNGINGYTWGPVKTKRWGTNLIDQIDVTATIGSTTTWGMVGDFTKTPLPGSTTDEGVVVTGDSGGALFVQEGGEWVLAGILFARSSFTGQPANTSLYGNETWAVDLGFYRDQIVQLVRPECSDEVDNDADGLIDEPADPQCWGFEDQSEGFDCEDGRDNDADGFYDFPSDPGCADYTWARENPECDDNVDNDGDGLIDFDGGGVGAADPQCNVGWKTVERSVPAGSGSCGLGPGVAAVLAMAGVARRRRR